MRRVSFAKGKKKYICANPLRHWLLFLLIFISFPKLSLVVVVLALSCCCLFRFAVYFRNFIIAFGWVATVCWLCLPAAYEGYGQCVLLAMRRQGSAVAGEGRQKFWIFKCHRFLWIMNCSMLLCVWVCGNQVSCSSVASDYCPLWVDHWDSPALSIGNMIQKQLPVNAISKFCIYSPKSTYEKCKQLVREIILRFVLQLVMLISSASKLYCKLFR